MVWQLTPLALATAIALPAWCAQRGLRRLAPNAALSDFELAAASSAGAFCGFAAAHIGQNSGHLSAATVFLCGFLGAAAYVDWRTGWAPTELVAPVCIATGFCAGTDGNGISVLFLSSAAIGGGLFSSAWALFALQARAGQIWFPPADAIALAIPLILFETHLAKAALFVAVAAVLLGVKHLHTDGHDGRPGRVALPDGKVALLAVAHPALLFGMLAEALTVHFSVGTGAFNG